MGMTVVRSHTLGISTGHPDSFEPQLGVFNHSALDTADYAISVAERVGLKLIIPLTNNGCYVAGCRMDFTRWLGLANHSDFYVNPAPISAFRNYVRERLEHINPYTGRMAKDEPAIMAWESGNELTWLEGNKGGPPPSEWTRGLAAFCKSLDPNHLFVDGAYGIDPATLSSAHIDVHSNHYYPYDTSRLEADAALCEPAGKPLLVGEYGWHPAEQIDAFLSAAEARAPVVAGTAFWSTFPHSDDYGFVQHGDGFTFHYPGDDASMRRFAARVRTHAFRMADADEPPLGPPQVPPLVTWANGTHIAWAGAAMAANYSVRWRPPGAVDDVKGRANAKGPAIVQSPTDVAWRVLCDQCATDNDTPLRIAGKPLPSGSALQVIGYNEDGVAGPPSAVWPLVLQASG